MKKSEALNILGLQDGASDDDIKKAHRKLVIENHPDKFGADAAARAKAEEKTKLINEARDVLLSRKWTPEYSTAGTPYGAPFTYQPYTRPNGNGQNSQGDNPFAGWPFSGVDFVWTTWDAQGNPHALTHGTYIPMMHGSDRTLRKSAFDNLYAVYGQYRNTLAATLAAQAKQLWFFAQARKYPSALAAALDRTEVPEAVYHNLIAAVRENLPKMYRYVGLRKKLLGVEELHFYDLYADMVGDVEMKFPFEEAKEIALKALAPLGSDYGNILKEGFEERWIDVYENAGKRSGAYSAGTKVHPFVLLNYHDTLNDLFTLVHEMGHALHSELSNWNQPTVYSDYVIFVAEVASTCNEALLMEYLLKNTTDKKERAYLINYFLEQFRTTLYRQTMFAEFEEKINQLAQNGEGITADVCCALYRQLNQDYFGPDIVVDDAIALEWARIPHFYYNYDVYQYATGYAAAIALSRRILKEGEPAVEDYLKFLRGGSSLPPIELLKLAGVDMSTADPINQALALFDELIGELEELLTD